MKSDVIFEQCLRACLSTVESAPKMEKPTNSFDVFGRTIFHIEMIRVEKSVLKMC